MRVVFVEMNQYASYSSDKRGRTLFRISEDVQLFKVSFNEDAALQ